MKQNSLSTLLQLAIRNEIRACDLYQALGDMFDHEITIRSIFLDMRQDEIRHAELLMSMRNSLKEEVLMTEIDMELWHQATTASKNLADASMVAIENLNDAYELVHELESSEINHLLIDLISRFGQEESQIITIINK